MSRPGPPPVPGGRTPEERAAARREREARRAAREGQSPPPVAAEPVWTDGDEPFAERAATEREDPARRLVPALVGGALFLVVAWFLLSLLQPFKGDGEGRLRVLIPKGAGVGEIADLLDDRGVVSSSFFFELRATLSGSRGDLKPGSYRLKEGMSHGAALDALTAGPAPDIVTITVPEGRSRRETAAIVGDSLDGDYLAATTRSPALDPREYGAKAAGDLEGFLFPATYELKRGRPVEELVRQQLSAFRQAFEGIDQRYARSKNLTPYEVLIIASMVEREAQVARERRLIASVIYNRLREGMPLGIDATIRFATNNWTRPLRQSELRTSSAYNTRTRPGLPPGPIGNPGLASIKAAARPARTGFLYYVVKPGGDGAHDFSSSDAEFQRDVQRYNRERARQGGRSPD